MLIQRPRRARKGATQRHSPSVYIVRILATGDKTASECTTSRQDQKNSRLRIEVFYALDEATIGANVISEGNHSPPDVKKNTISPYATGTI